MSKFSKGKKRKDPAISTAALPDIVFMLLFKLLSEIEEGEEVRLGY